MVSLYMLNNPQKWKIYLHNMKKTQKSPVIYQETKPAASLFSTGDSKMQHEDATGFWPSWGYNKDLSVWPLPFQQLLEILWNCQLNPPLYCPGLCCHFIKHGVHTVSEVSQTIAHTFPLSPWCWRGLSGWASLSHWLPPPPPWWLCI